VLSFELQAGTDAGRRFVDACEGASEVFAGRAADVDQKGQFPVENVEELRDRGLLGAAVPAELGGWGVESIHDLAVGISRLGRGDSSMAIAFTMHLTVTWSVARFWRALGLAALQDQLTAVAAGEVIAIGGTEAGTSILYPQTTAEPAEGGGWRLNGRTIFGTLSPVADRFVFAVRVLADPTHPQIGNAFVERDAPGLTVLDNWDALGMRGSGSGDIVLEDVVVAGDRVLPSGEWGRWNEIELVNLTAGNAVLIGAFLGIAETARDHVVELLRTRRKVPDDAVLAHRPALQHGTGELEIALTSARAVLDRVTRLADEYLGSHGPFDAEIGDLHSLMKEFQCAKWIVNRRAIEVVDLAMTLSGGAGFMSSNPLSRLYRDVRAGPFMQPFSPNEAFEYIGRVVLGLEADEDR
jgi:alkylation response protein AidB-like acyl-CoA dehydrogenase